MHFRFSLVFDLGLALGVQCSEVADRPRGIREVLVVFSVARVDSLSSDTFSDCSASSVSFSSSVSFG